MTNETSTEATARPAFAQASALGALGDAVTDCAAPLNAALAARQNITLDGVHALSAPLVIGGDYGPGVPGFGYMAGRILEGTNLNPNSSADGPWNGQALVAASSGMASVVQMEGPGFWNTILRRLTLQGHSDGSTETGFWQRDGQGTVLLLEDVYVLDCKTGVLISNRNGENGEGARLVRCMVGANTGGVCFKNVNGQSYYTVLKDCVMGGDGVTVLQFGPDKSGGGGFGADIRGLAGTVGAVVDSQGRAIRNTLLRLIATDGPIRVGIQRYECLGPTTLCEWSGGSLSFNSDVTFEGGQYTGFRYDCPFLDGTLNLDAEGNVTHGNGIVNANHTVRFVGCQFGCDAQNHTAPALGQLPALPRPGKMPLIINWQPGDQTRVEFVGCTFKGWGDLSQLFAYQVNTNGRGGIVVTDCWRDFSPDKSYELSWLTAANASY